jgi:hypothetical protein
MSNPQTPAPPPSPTIPLNKLAEVLRSTIRWRILREPPSNHAMEQTPGRYTLHFLR